MDRITARGILGVGQDAPQEQIKTAYRRLAKRYHPDRNPNEQAVHKFQELKEAYELLMRAEDDDYWSPIDEEAKAYDAQQAWREELRARRARERHEKALQQAQLMQQLYRGLNYAMGAYLIFLSLLIVDYVLPASEHPEEITTITQVYFSGRGAGNRTLSHQIVHFQNYRMRLSREEGAVSFGSATVYTTPLLQVVLGADVSREGKQRELAPVYGLYHRFGLLIPIAFVLGLLYYRLPLSGERRLNVAIVTLFIAVFHIVLILQA